MIVLRIVFLCFLFFFCNVKSQNICTSEKFRKNQTKKEIRFEKSYFDDSLNIKKNRRNYVVIINNTSFIDNPYKVNNNDAISISGYSSCYGVRQYYISKKRKYFDFWSERMGKKRIYFKKNFDYIYVGKSYTNNLSILYSQYIPDFSCE